MANEEAAQTTRSTGRQVDYASENFKNFGYVMEKMFKLGSVAKP